MADVNIGGTEHSKTRTGYSRVQRQMRATASMSASRKLGGADRRGVTRISSVHRVCERPDNSAASSPPRHSTIRSKRQHFSRAAESRSRHPDRCSPLGPARGHVAHNAHSGPVGRRAEGEASAAALRLSSSQSQAPAR